MKPTHESDGIPEIEPDIPENAVRLYGQSDAMDDFPVPLNELLNSFILNIGGNS